MYCLDPRKHFKNNFTSYTADVHVKHYQILLGSTLSPDRYSKYYMKELEIQLVTAEIELDDNAIDHSAVTFPTTP